MTSIPTRISSVRHRIAEAASRCGRSPDSVTLLAVSKTKTAGDIRIAASCGQLHFGENYLQEALNKQPDLTDLPLIWHFIGPIQSNKTRLIAEHFSWVHSIDRLKIAERLNEQRPAHLPPLQICIQINISDEATKSGCSPEALPALLEAILPLPRLQVRGLMAIPDHANMNQLTSAFARMQSLFIEMKAIAPHLDTLSMGMSADLSLAIQHGATIVRVGSDIFGSRQTAHNNP